MKEAPSHYDLWVILHANTFLLHSKSDVSDPVYREDLSCGATYTTPRLPRGDAVAKGNVVKSRLLHTRTCFSTGRSVLADESVGHHPTPIPRPGLRDFGTCSGLEAKRLLGLGEQLRVASQLESEKLVFVPLRGG